MHLISKISFEPGFISGLLEKLKVGNRRGIHLNALPGHHRSRLDLHDLDFVKKGMANDFLKKLLSETSFSFRIDFEGIKMVDLSDDEQNRLFLIARRLNNLVYDVEDQYLEFGVKNFALGYPLLIRRDRSDPTKVTKAPLLLWALNIEKSPRKMNCWTISREEGSPIVVNELFRSHIASDAQIKIERLDDDLLSDGIIDEEELPQICKSVLAQLNTQVPDDTSLKPKVLACPSREKAEALAQDDTWLHWAGVFGLYRARKEPIIKRAEEMLGSLADFKNKKLELEDFQKSTVAPVKTDPSKEEIISSLTKNEIRVIQGPPGTGKSQALTAIITNTLENGGTCLVVCEKRTALDVIYQNLKRLRLDDLAVVVEDVNRDRNNIVNKARSRAEILPQQIRHDRTFDVLYGQYEDLKKHLCSRHATVSKKVLGDFSWTDIVGMFLHSTKRAPALLKAPPYQACSFSSDEYEDINLRVSEAASLYNACDVSSLNALALLRDELFQNPYSRGVFDEFSAYAHKQSKLLRDTAEAIAALTEIRIETLFPLGNATKLSEWIGLLKNVEGLLKSAAHSLASCIPPSDEKKGRRVAIEIVDIVGRFFSRKIEKMCVSKEQFREAVMRYQEIIGKFPKNAGIPQIVLSKETSVEDALALVGTARNKIQEIQGTATDLNVLFGKMKRCDSMLKKHVDKYTKYLHVDLGGHPFDMTVYARALAEELKYFENLETQLHEFRPFHDWRYFEGQLSDLQRNLIEELKKYPTETWKDIARAWYFYGLLTRQEQNISGAYPDEVGKIIDIQKEMRASQVKKIRSLWEQRASESKNRFEKGGTGFNILYNLRRNRQYRKLSLRKILEKDMPLFTSFFPVILTNPIVADSILPLEQGLFNVVIFDEASQLRIEDTFTSLIRGQYKIVAGDEHQMPPSNYFEATIRDTGNTTEESEEKEELDTQGELARSDSLLDYARNLALSEPSHLDYHYRSLHPALIEFSNAAFYGGNLVTFPELEEYTPIDFRHVDGSYKDNINVKEVEEVLKILKEDIHPGADGRYPSLGIATFNIKQRDAIIDALHHESSVNNDFSLMMEKIKEQGFFVKNLENIQGDEMDIMIISTTYGTDSDNRFFERFGPINHGKGYKLLNVMITRARQKIYVCTSIPATRYRRYAEDIQNYGNHRKGIMYAYLAYTEAVSTRNDEEAEAILKMLRAHSHDRPRPHIEIGLTESPFEEEVYEILLEKLGTERVSPQVKVGGFRIDFVVSVPKGRPIAIECDGKTYHSSNEAHAYDTYRQTELENLGYSVYRIWSTQWWHDHKKEEEKLMRFVEKIGSKVVS